MLIGLSGVTGFIIGVLVYWASGQTPRQHARALRSDNANLRHVISELSLHKYGPQK